MLSRTSTDRLALRGFHEEGSVPKPGGVAAQLKDLLGQSVEVGRKVIESRRGPTTDAWREHTKELVAEALGPGEAIAVFTLKYREPKPPQSRADRSFSLMNQMLNPPPPYGAEYVNNLHDLIGRVDNLLLRSDFDPEDWSAFDPDAFEATHARPIQWSGEERAVADCPYCGTGVSTGHTTCDSCGAELWNDFAFKDTET